MLSTARLDLDRTTLDETFRMGTTLFEIMLEDPNLQVVGITIIVDLADLTVVQQARLISPSLAWHLANILQVRCYRYYRIKSIKHIFCNQLQLCGIYTESEKWPG